jgi:hypothetical protein
MFIIATANKQFQLTAGKFVPVSNITALNVCEISNNKKEQEIFAHIREVMNTVTL